MIFVSDFFLDILTTTKKLKTMMNYFKTIKLKKIETNDTIIRDYNTYLYTCQAYYNLFIYDRIKINLNICVRIQDLSTCSSFRERSGAFRFRFRFSLLKPKIIKFTKREFL